MSGAEPAERSATLERWRLFVGVPVSAEVRAAIAAAIAPFRTSVRARWVRPESLHVTLSFLGDRPSADAAELGQLASALVAPFAPFRAALGGPGGAGRRGRPATVWVELATGVAELTAMMRAVAVGLAAADAEREPQPHITVARDVPPATISAVHDALRALSGVGWTVHEAALWRSHLGAGGSRYESIARLPLQGRTAIS